YSHGHPCRHCEGLPLGLPDRSAREDKLGSDKRRGPVIPISTFTQHSQRLSTKSLITHLPCSPQSFTPTSSQAVPDLSLSVHPWVSLRFFLYLRPKVLS